MHTDRTLVILRTWWETTTLGLEGDGTGSIIIDRRSILLCQLWVITILFEYIQRNRIRMFFPRRGISPFWCNFYDAAKVLRPARYGLRESIAERNEWPASRSSCNKDASRRYFSSRIRHRYTVSGSKKSCWRAAWTKLIDKPESFLSLARFIKDAAASLFFTEHETWKQQFSSMNGDNKNLTSLILVMYLKFINNFTKLPTCIDFPFRTPNARFLHRSADHAIYRPRHVTHGKFDVESAQLSFISQSASKV